MRTTLGLARTRLARAGTLRCGWSGVPLVWQVRGPHAVASAHILKNGHALWLWGEKVSPRRRQGLTAALENISGTQKSYTARQGDTRTHEFGHNLPY